MLLALLVALTTTAVGVVGAVDPAILLPCTMIGGAIGWRGGRPPVRRRGQAWLAASGGAGWGLAVSLAIGVGGIPGLAIGHAIGGALAAVMVCWWAGRVARRRLG